MNSIEGSVNVIQVDDKIFESVTKALRSAECLAFTIFAEGGDVGDVIHGCYVIAVHSQKYVAHIEMPIKILMEGNSE